MKWWDQMPWSYFFNVNFQPSFFTVLFTLIKRLFSSSSLSGGIICISEVVDISPGNLESSLCFIHPGISHDILRSLECPLALGLLPPGLLEDFLLKLPDFYHQPSKAQFLLWRVQSGPGWFSLWPWVVQPLALEVKLVLVTQSCLTLHDPMDYSLPGSSAHGIFQARVLAWGAIAFWLNP